MSVHIEADNLVKPRRGLEIDLLPLVIPGNSLWIVSLPA